MIESNNKKVSDFCNALEESHPEFHLITLTVREYFLSCDQDIHECIKYGGIIFTKGKEDFGGIFIYQNHCSIEFHYGVNLDDPDGLLEGSGKFRRHLKIRNKEDLHKKQAQIFITRAYKAIGE